MSKMTARRLGRSVVMVLVTGLLIGVVALTFFPKQQTAQAIECYSCAPHTPEPGPARSWEVDIPVSTYSRVNTRHGNVFTAIPIVGWSGRGPDMAMMLYHNSANVGVTDTYALATGFSLGAGWSTSYSDHLLLSDLPNTVTVVAANGTKDLFTWNGSIWVAPPGVHNVLDSLGGVSVTWKLTHKDQSFHEFDQQSELARLTRVVDAVGNAMTLTYNEGVLERIKDASDRPLVFSTDPVLLPGLLNGIQDPVDSGNPPESGLLNRSWGFYYDAGRLEHIHDAMFYENAFVYDTNGRLYSVSDKYAPFDPADMPDLYVYGYDSGGRLNSVLDPEGGLTQGFLFTCQECPDWASQVRTLKSYYTDRRGNNWRLDYAADLLVPEAYIKQIINPPNGWRNFQYDAYRNLVQFCHYSGVAYDCWNSTYDSDGNRLSLEDPLGNTQTWTYDDANNVRSFTDAAESVTQFKYETSVPTLLTKMIECPVALANPMDECPPWSDAPTTTLAYYLGENDNGKGQLKEVIDPNGAWTGFEYDLWGQLQRYIEGRVTLDPVYYIDTTVDCGGRNVFTRYCGGGGQTAGGNGGCGSSGFDANNNATSSACTFCGVAGGPTAAVPQDFPPVPCSGTSPPQIWAGFSGAEYSPKGELTSLPTAIHRGDDSQIRTHTGSFDNLGRQTDATVSSDEHGGSTPIDRGFIYDSNWATGTYTRTGPDGVLTTVQLDTANRVQSVTRGLPNQSPLMTADYTYFDNDLMESITYGNLASIWYTYDAARRVTAIEHRNPSGGVILHLAYTYTANDLPSTITEWGTSVSYPTTTEFTYGHRNRLTYERRWRDVGGVNVYEYDLEYRYDKGGNRTLKIDNTDPMNPRQVVYHYDVHWEEEPGATDNPYGSFNNRLMKAEQNETCLGLSVLRSTTWYYYTQGGNVERVVTTEEPECGGQQNSAISGGELESSTAAPAVDDSEGSVGTTVDESPSPFLGEGWGEGGGEAAAFGPGGPGGGGGGAGCTDPQKKYTATRFEYAKNGATVTYVLGEQWCLADGASCPENYKILWAREFRYDGSRARYMSRKLDPIALQQTGAPVDLGTTWSDYDGDETYGDFTVTGTTVTNTDSYQPGLWRRMKVGTNFVPEYLHNDHLGTLRQTTGTTGTAGASRVFTAFGERISGTNDRFGYVGAWGYQAHSIAESTNPDGAFPYLHVGARYYDPSSGRFLQRDPIGIRGGLNVYAYAGVDPSGLAALQVGIGGSIILPGWIGAISAVGVGDVSIFIDDNGNVGIGITVGVGPGIGGYVGGGVVVGGYSGTVGGLAGPSGEIGVDVGIGPVTGSVSGVLGPGYSGLQIGAGGIGLGAGGRATGNFTGMLWGNPFNWARNAAMQCALDLVIN